MNINSVKDKVKGYLELVPATREDDYLLWFYILNHEAAVRNYDALYTRYTTLADFLQTAKYSKYPHFETVSRARRKLQAEYPELRATEETRKAREEYEKQYRAFARAIN